MQMVRVELRTVVMDVPPQDVISRDNVSVKVNAVVFFRVIDPQRAIIQVEDYYKATNQLAQTTLRSVLGKHELDEMLAERDKLNLDIQKILDTNTDAWGIKVTTVEIKHVDIDPTMVRAIAQQAEAERTRRAKIIHAEGEHQAAEKAGAGGRTDQQEPAGVATALSADPFRDRQRENQYHRLPAADGSAQAVPERAEEKYPLLSRIGDSHHHLPLSRGERESEAAHGHPWPSRHMCILHVAETRVARFPSSARPSGRSMVLSVSKRNSTNG